MGGGAPPLAEGRCREATEGRHTSVALLLLATACVTHSLDYTGLACDDAHPCPVGLTCGADKTCGGGSNGGGDGGTSTDAGCPFDLDPAASACSGTTWYLSPAGNDSADGKSVTTAKATLTGVTVSPGDVVHLLGGTWPTTPAITAAMSGSSACPVLFDGESDGGTVLVHTLHLDATFAVLRHLTFTPKDEDAINAGGAKNVTFQFDTFRAQMPTPGQYPSDLFLPGDGCKDCVVRQCRFESDGTNTVLSEAQTPSAFSFYGNTVVMKGASLSFVGPALVEANDFSGHFSAQQNSGLLDFTKAPNSVVRRNVFHDIDDIFDSPMIWKAGRVTNNTFVRISGNDTAPLVIGAGRFDDNIASITGWVVKESEADGGDYNLFDPSVGRPFGSFDGGALNGTDQLAAVGFDPSGYVPAAGNAAVDRGDPSLPVPLGGGTRADIGAFERGATPIADGRYCLPDGGNP
ncbi:MAG: hypothetical protein QM723_28145 [Myxococcaceae bacterium]